MDKYGLICFIWAIVFVVACRNYGLMTWDYLFFWRRSLKDIVSHYDRWKGILFAPFLYGIIIPLGKSDFSPDEIVMTVVRLVITAIGLWIGVQVADKLSEDY